MKNEFITHLIKIGRAVELLNQIQMSDIFFDLSKHNPLWHSEDEEQHDQLNKIRRELILIEDKLSEVHYILNNQEEMGE